MIIVAIREGLGNQLFQYAAGRREAWKKNTELKLDISEISENRPEVTPREYALGDFNIQASLISTEEAAKIAPAKSPFRKLLKKIEGIVFRKDHSLQGGKKFDFGADAYLVGYFQNEKWFSDAEEIIRKDLTLRNLLGAEAERAASSIRSAKMSVSLHVRRGDYVSDASVARFNGTCSPEYYEKALEILKGKMGGDFELFVFSDDIPWARQNIAFPFPTRFVSNPAIRDSEEMYLMSLCTHHIIANSTFSWWGAWLDPKKEKIVIAPDKWWKGVSPKSYEGIVPASWIKI